VTIETLLSTDKLSEQDLLEIETLSDLQLEEYFRPYLSLTRPQILVDPDAVKKKAEEKSEKIKVKKENKTLSLLERAQQMAMQHGAVFNLDDIKNLPPGIK